VMMSPVSLKKMQDLLAANKDAEATQEAAAAEAAAEGDGDGSQ